MYIWRRALFLQADLAKHCDPEDVPPALADVFKSFGVGMGTGKGSKKSKEKPIDSLSRGLRDSLMELPQDGPGGGSLPWPPGHPKGRGGVDGGGEEQEGAPGPSGEAPSEIPSEAPGCVESVERERAELD